MTDPVQPTWAETNTISALNELFRNRYSELLDLNSTAIAEIERLQAKYTGEGINSLTTVELSWAFRLISAAYAEGLQNQLRNALGRI